jgi:CrcB protein
MTSTRRWRVFYCPDKPKKGNRMTYLIVFLGGGIGSALRHGVNLAAARLLGIAFPYGTLTVNVVGSLIMGLLGGYFAFRGDASQHWRLFLTTGILGGFTTFSTFSLDCFLLWERHQFLSLAAYLLGSLVLSIGAVGAGVFVVRNLGS